MCIRDRSVKTTETPGVRGYVAAKKVKGRKCHILVDTIVLLLIVVVHTAISRIEMELNLFWNRLRGHFVDCSLFGLMLLIPVNYTHLRAHETDSYLVCRLLLE